jgi:hypothetical protein
MFELLWIGLDWIGFRNRRNLLHTFESNTKSSLSLRIDVKFLQWKYCLIPTKERMNKFGVLLSWCNGDFWLKEKGWVKSYFLAFSKSTFWIAENLQLTVRVIEDYSLMEIWKFQVSYGTVYQGFDWWLMIDDWLFCYWISWSEMKCINQNLRHLSIYFINVITNS